MTGCLLDRTRSSPWPSKHQSLHFRPHERCQMNTDPKDSDIDETPEYPLPSPTDSLSRDQRPPDDEAGIEQVPNEDVRRGDSDVEANPDDSDSADEDGLGEPS